MDDKRSFIKLFHQSVKGGFAMDVRELTGEAARLLLYMLMISNKGFVFRTQSEIAKDLKLKQPNVSTSLKELVDAGFIIRINVGAYTFNERWAKYGED